MFREMTEEEASSIKWPVDINIPKSGGGVNKEKMVCHFNIIDDDEYKELANSDDPDRNILRRVLGGWGESKKVGDTEKTIHGFYDHDGNHLEFSEENRERLIKISYARVSIVNAYIFMRTGNKSAARKN